MTAPQLPDLPCNVCGSEPAFGVFAMPGIPGSFAYCQPCQIANAHPYGIIVANTAMIGGLDQAAPWWIGMVECTLTRLEIPREQFDADLAAEIEEWRREEEKLRDL